MSPITTREIYSKTWGTLYSIKRQLSPNLNCFYTQTGAGAGVEFFNSFGVGSEPGLKNVRAPTPTLKITGPKLKIFLRFMEKRCLRQLEALIKSFNFYWKRFLKRPLYKTLWPKIRFFTCNCTPPVVEKSESPPNIFSRLFILELALSITKVSTRSGCYTWDTSLVRRLNFFQTVGGIQNNKITLKEKLLPRLFRG